MKIKSLSIQGFRGFNKLKTIDIHDRITLIYAANSYGKTSISEAFEWLIYGVTSKVDHAESKDEYKGSYRNRHFSGSDNPFVKVVFDESGNEIVFTSELIGDDGQKKLIDIGGNASEIEDWPLEKNVSEYARPFILQHSLKNLLLTKPDDRFQRFAELLGFEILDQVHKNIISLCTAADRRIPSELKPKIDKVDALIRRVDANNSMSTLQQVFRNKTKTISDVNSALMNEARKVINSAINDDAVFPELLRMRKEAIGKVFEGRITLSQYTDNENRVNIAEEDYINNFVTENFMKDYLSLIALVTVAEILDKSRFYGLGINFLQASPLNCPFCGQSLDDSLRDHVRTKHKEAEDLSKSSESLDEQKKNIVASLNSLRERVKLYNELNSNRVDDFLSIETSLDVIKKILGLKQEEYYKELASLAHELRTDRTETTELYDFVIKTIDAIDQSINLSSEDSDHIKNLSDALIKYISSSRKLAGKVTSKAKTVSNIDQLVQHELDVLAGTEEISLLIDLFDNKSTIDKKIKTETIVESLKLLRKVVDQYVGKRILDAVSGELTKSVMGWYEKIKTQGDPDIHFDGFDLDRTAKGELKARRVAVKAKSYGQDLVSAVSSLSESKLNALGLCVSIATNLKKETPFSFLVIDDPIQSLDADHEIQFIEIIQDLINDHQKQIILLSHDKGWIDQVLNRCRELNGLYYEITQYSKDGPHISSVEWIPWKERLKIVSAILEDNNAGSVKLQQAEEEIRFIVCQLASAVYAKRKGIAKSAHSLNENGVERILTECSIDSKLVKKIVQTFSTTDDSHHTGKDYAPNRQRIRQYYDWTLELVKQV